MTKLRDDLPRIAHFVEVDHRAEYAKYLDACERRGLVVSWGEKVKKSGTTFFITFSNNLAILQTGEGWGQYLAGPLYKLNS